MEKEGKFKLEFSWDWEDSFPFSFDGLVGLDFILVGELMGFEERIGDNFSGLGKSLVIGSDVIVNYYECFFFEVFILMIFYLSLIY